MECMKFQSVDETAKESVDASIPITELLSFALNRMKQLPRVWNIDDYMVLL